MGVGMGSWLSVWVVIDVSVLVVVVAAVVLEAGMSLLVFHFHLVSMKDAVRHSQSLVLVMVWKPQHFHPKD